MPAISGYTHHNRHKEKSGDIEGSVDEFKSFSLPDSEVRIDKMDILTKKKEYLLYNLMPIKDPCKEFACRIQACLKENKYQEPACQHVIEEMRECCRKWKDKSYVCGGIDTSKEEKSQK